MSEFNPGGFIDRAQSFDPKHPDLGWQPAIPLSFKIRRWFRWKPQCPSCRITFKDEEAWGAHWLRLHRNGENA